MSRKESERVIEELGTPNRSTSRSHSIFFVVNYILARRG